MLQARSCEGPTSFEGLTGLGQASSRRHTHTAGRSLLTIGRRIWFPSFWNSPLSAWVHSSHYSLPLHIKWLKGEQDRSCNICYDVALEVIHRCFCNSPMRYGGVSFSVGEGMMWIPGDKNHWMLSWKLATAKDIKEGIEFVYDARIK
jgi:hypothetical protein